MDKSCTNNNSKKPSYFPYSYDVQKNASVGTADTIVDPSCEITEETLTKDGKVSHLKTFIPIISSFFIEPCSFNHHLFSHNRGLSFGLD